MRLVESRLTGIERARKAVVLPDDSILPYATHPPLTLTLTPTLTPNPGPNNPNPNPNPIPNPTPYVSRYDYLVVAPELGDQTLVPLGADASAVR